MRNLLFLFLSCVFIFGCPNNKSEVADIANFAIEGPAGIISQSDIEFDQTNSSDGNGSAKISATKPKVIRLYETGDIDVENAQLTYRARIRTKNINGQAFLEMWCSFPGKGEYFSRAMHAPLSGTNEWTTQETYFFLKKGDNPDNVKLNVVINGTGTIWIDDIRLIRGPMQ